MSSLRFLAKPAAAFELVNPATPPQASEKAASARRISPLLMISESGAPALIAFTIFAVMKGIAVSATASQTMKISVNIVGLLYSLTDFKSLLNICIIYLL